MVSKCMDPVSAFSGNLATNPSPIIVEIRNYTPLSSLTGYAYDARSTSHTPHDPSC